MFVVFSLAIIVLVKVDSACAMGIDEYLKTVVERNKLIESYRISVEASAEKQGAGDIGLAPVLSAGYTLTTDKSQPSSVADQRDSEVASLGLAKKFSTGTSLSLSAQTNKFTYITPVTAGNNGFSTGNLGLSLTQSLWKDFFGSATRLRRQREAAVNKTETLGLDLQRRNLLIQAETDFWDYMVAQEDLKFKQTNLERAKKLQNWTANRVNNGISDQADLLQVRALTSLRELELSNAQDEMRAREVKIRENLSLEDVEPIPLLTADMATQRPYIQTLSTQKKVIRIDSYIASLDARIKKTSAEEVQDSLRPDLLLNGQYKTSSYDLVHSEMQKNIAKTDRPVTSVGLTFSWLFGSSAKSSQLSAARKDALSAQYRAEQSLLAGQNAWAEHLRKYELTQQNVKILERLSQLQKERSREQQSMFTKGRTITSNVVDAETDSAEAEVNYLKAKAGLRKLEAATQLYMPAEDL